MSSEIAPLIQHLNEVDESEGVEAKRSQDELGKSALETISAFSNEPGLGGGTLLFGLTETNDGFAVTGVSDPGKLASDLASVCATAFNRPLRPRIIQEVVEGHPVVAAVFPEAAPGDKPVFIAARGMHRGSFRRIGGTDQGATEDDLRALFGAAVGEACEDTIVRDAAMDDLDPEVIAGYRRGLLSINPGTELRDATDEELVLSLGGAVRRQGSLAVTVAGVLLFGKALALRRLFPALRVDYVRIPGTTWVPEPDRRFDTVEIRAPLLAAFRRAYAAVSDDLPRTFALEPGSPERKDKLAIPESVLREVLVNALTHRSYRTQSAVQILRFNDRIEVRNPGHSLVDDERLGDPGSYSRNPRLADVFREMRLAENKGTGIAAMKRAMKMAGLTPPFFQSDRRSDTFVATLWLHNLLGPEETEWLQGFAALALSDAQAQALVIARRTGEVRNSSLRDVTDLDPIAARRELHGLRAHGLLRMENQRGGAYYVLDGRAVAGPGGADRGVLNADRGVLGSDRGVLPSDRGVLRAGKRGLPPELEALLESLGRRPRTPTLRAAILRLCEGEFRKPRELADWLDFDLDKLRDRHLSPMAAQGLLVRKFPETPRHPDQAYRAAQGALSPATKE
ncbi:MAG TPA: ATP-binding protein [Anaeromyxobacteraceae bacterium]|jgi:ATP-dependent DNA helicase RecG|nr:ATP-binding protein [Anaeromyxobacteraceae bacterium]